MKKYINTREFLTLPYKLTADITINKVLSEGGSSLTYLGSTKTGEMVVVKEKFPRQFPYELKRDYSGAIVMVIHDNAASAIIKETLLEQAVHEEQMAMSVFAGAEGNIPHYYPMDLITDEVVAYNPNLKNTLSQYLVSRTYSGETLAEVLDKLTSDEKKYTLTASLNYIKKILDVIEYAHEKKHVLHMDLKPENIYFQNSLHGEINSECILLDCGSMVNYDYENQSIIDAVYLSSMSLVYAAPEVQKYFFNRNKSTVADYYLSSISPGSDIYSVGVCLLLLLITDQKRLLKEWRQRWHKPDNHQTEVKKWLEKAVFSSLKDDFDSNNLEIIRKMTTNILWRALYNFTNDLPGEINMRYKNANEMREDINSLLEFLADSESRMILTLDNNPYADLSEYYEKVNVFSQDDIMKHQLRLTNTNPDYEWSSFIINGDYSIKGKNKPNWASAVCEVYKQIDFDWSDGNAIELQFGEIQNLNGFTIEIQSSHQKRLIDYFYFEISLGSNKLVIPLSEIRKGIRRHFKNLCIVINPESDIINDSQPLSIEINHIWVIN